MHVQVMTPAGQVAFVRDVVVVGGNVIGFHVCFDAASACCVDDSQFAQLHTVAALCGLTAARRCLASLEICADV
jgi:hypothetical protein